MARIPLVTEFESRGLDRAIKEFKKLETTGQKVGYGLKKAFLPAAGALAGLAAAAVPAISKASDLNENLSKTSVIFGDAADAVIKFSETTAKSLGQSQTQALEAAGTFGTFGKAAGLAGEDLSTFTTDFVTLASDLASFNNTEPQEAIDAIGAALRGEAEPMRRFGVLLNDATLKTEAMNLGIYDGVGALTDQQKILAAQAAIYKQTGDAQGDFARTSDGLANMQRTLTAQFDDFQATLGEALLPIAEALLPVLVGITDWAANNTDVVLGIGAAVATFAAAIVGANIAMSVWGTIAAVTTAINGALGTSFTALWVATGVGIIVAIIGAIVILQLKFNILGKAVDALKWAFEKAWDAIKWVINKIIDGINEVISVLNKIPGVDIPELGHLGDQAKDAAVKARSLGEQIKNAALKAEYAREPMGRFERSVFKVEKQADKLERTIGTVDKALDPLNQGIETATSRLDAFFDAMDKQEATDDFIEEIKEIERTLGNAAIGSDQFVEAQNDAYEAVRQLRTEREDLSDAFYEALIINIDKGDLERVYTLMSNLVDLGGREIPIDFAVDLPSLGITEGALFGGTNFAGGFGTTVINNFMPPGVTPEELLASQREQNTRRGVATYEVAGAGVL